MLYRYTDQNIAVLNKSDLVGSLIIICQFCCLWCLMWKMYHSLLVHGNCRVCASKQCGFQRFNLRISEILDTNHECASNWDCSAKIAEEKIIKWFVLRSMNIFGCSIDWISAFDQLNLLITGQMGGHEMWCWKLQMTRITRIAVNIRMIKFILKFQKWCLFQQVLWKQLFFDSSLQSFN